MKIRISKTLKILFIVINAMLILGVVVYFYLYYIIPRYKEDIIIKYSYKQKADVNYQVMLIPNDLYEEKSLNEGNIYITQLIDHINVAFNYNFEGSKPTDIKGDYEIVAILEGYIVEKEARKTLWKKILPISAKANIEENEGIVSINRKVPIRLSEYSDFVKKVNEFLKFSTNVRFSIQMNVSLTADIDGTLLEEKMFPAIEIPLNVSYFTITKYNTGEKPGKIEETNQVQVHADKKIMIICGGAVVILILSLLYLIIYTTEPTKKDKYIKNLHKIFKNHGSRLVALNSISVNINHQCCIVRSIDDLVRIADELGRPIFYEHNHDFMKITKFFVFDDTWFYVLDLKDSLYNEAMNEILKEQSSKVSTQQDI